MASIRGEYEAKGVERFYAEGGATYSNPHLPLLREVLPRTLERLLGPMMPLTRGLLDLCAGSGEFTIVFRDWERRRRLSVKASDARESAGESAAPLCAITAADPYTFEAYERNTGQAAERWSFQDVCDGALDGRGGFDVVAISYAVHLLDRSRYFVFFQALARSARHMLIVSPTKNKGLVQPEHGWQEAAYISEEKVHSRLYESLAFFE